MKKILLLSCFIAAMCLSMHSSAQISPSTGSACVGDPFTFSTPVNAVTYQWEFSNTGPASIIQPMLPTVPLNTGGGPFAVPAFSCFMQDHTTGNYHLFVTEYNTGRLFRIDYGTNIFLPPTRTNLGNFGAPGGLAEGIDIVFDDVTNRWYGVMVNNTELIQIDFGAITNNTPVVTRTVLPELLWPHQITAKFFAGGWHAFVANRNGTITRIDFGGTLVGPILARTNLPNVGGVANPCNFTLYFQAPNWYMLVPSLINATVSRYDFGPSLMNAAPTGTLLPQGGNPVLNLPRQIFALNDCHGNVLAYTFNEGGRLIRLNFGGDITLMPTYTDMGPTGAVSLGSGTSCAYNDQFFYIIPSFSAGTFRVFAPFLNLSAPSPLNYHDQTQNWIAPATGSYDISLFYDMGRPSGPSVDCHHIEVDTCKRPCTDSTDITVTSTTDSTGACLFTATAHVWTSNVILGYKWSGVGPSVIHHSSLSTDSYTFSVGAGGTGVVTCTVYIVDTAFTDTATGPCCEAVMTQTVTCNRGCCFDSAATGLTSIGMSTSGGCLFNVSAYYAFQDERCKFLGYQWLTSFFSTLIVGTSSYGIPVPYGTTGYATVIFYALSPEGDTCTLTRTVYLDCPGKEDTSCCFDTSHTFLTVIGMSTPNGDCLFEVSAFYAFLPQNCQFLGYQWTTSSLSTGIIPASTMNIPVPAGLTGFATVTFYALNANGDTCRFTRTVTFRCPGDVNTDCCFDTVNTYLTALGMSSSSGGCIFTVSAFYAMADPRCYFIGYQWFTSFFSTGITSTSSFGVPVPAGGTGYATVVFYALNANGDTCKFTRTITFHCDEKQQHMMPRSPGQGAGDGKTGFKPEEIMIFPNPTDNVVKITAKNVEIHTIQVIDVNGKKVRDLSYEHTTSTSIPLNPLPPGSYLFKVNNTTSKVIVKQE